MIAESLMLGLSTGTVCSLHCIPSAVPYLASGELERKTSHRKVLLFLAGRLVAYLAVGAVLGFLGRLTMDLVGEEFYRWLTLSGNILVGLFLLVNGIFSHLKKRKCFPFSGKREYVGILMLGVLTGLNICPPFVAATAGAFSSGSLPAGMLYFLLFFAGTSLYLLPLFAIGFLKKYSRQINAVCRIALIILGLYFIFKGVMLL